MCSYANSPNLATIELMNEPHAPGVTLDNLKNYYKYEYETLNYVMQKKKKIKLKSKLKLRFQPLTSSIIQ